MTDAPPSPGTARRPGFLSVLRMREFRAMFVAHLLSLVGDQIAKVALAVLVFDRTSSPALAATTYALTFLPWLIGAPALAGLGDRFPRRSVLIVCDLVRAGVLALMAMPGMPIGILLGLLGVVSLLAPPFESARAALLADVVVGEPYVLASALTNLSFQGGQALGFAAGGLAAAALGPRGALAFDAGTFLVSAALLRIWVARRRTPTADAADPGAHSGALAGLRLVLRDPWLRSLVLLAWLASTFSIAPEGLAVPIVRGSGGSSLQAGLFTAAMPLGGLIGGILLARLVAPERRSRLLLPLALLSVAPLAFSGFDPARTVLFGLWVLGGVGTSFNLAAAPIFVQAVPPHLRARAFAIAQAGLQIVQGVGLLVVGLLADRIGAITVVAGSGALGIVAVLIIWARWPSRAT